MKTSQVLIIDNDDSFTYTIKYYFDCLGAKTTVVKNDDPRLAAIDRYFTSSHIVLSPGPGNPDDAGLTLQVIREYYQQYPMLGICLGHQCLAQAFGAQVRHANKVMHGKICQITHHQQGIFDQLPSPFSITRYHSLIVDVTHAVNDINVLAWVGGKPSDEDYEVMAIQHKHYPIFGVQYHPEAILTQHGASILRNFCNYLL